MESDTDALDACQRRIGYQFRNRELLRAAMIHASSADHRKDSNERLEFLGDTVLGLVVCHALYERLPSALEGELTKIKSAVVSRRACARVAENLRLTETLVLGQGMESGEHLPSSLAAAALEAVIAAVFLDGGLEPVRELILTHMAEEMRAATESEHQGNFKSQLQQYAQRHLNTTPQYEMLDEKGPDHSKCFEIAVSIGRRQFHGAWGPSKKEAEQKAAQIALVELGELEPEPEIRCRRAPSPASENGGATLRPVQQRPPAGDEVLQTPAHRKKTCWPFNGPSEADALPADDHRFSPKKLTQQQLFGGLALEEFLKTDSRGVVNFLADCADWCDTIERAFVPQGPPCRKLPIGF